MPDTLSGMDVELLFVVVGAVLVAAVARWRGWAAPLLVTTVALAVSFLPFVPDLQIDGHLLLNIVLPPLLYSASLDVSFVSFQRSLPQIRRLGVGLVVVTTVAVGLVAWWLMPSLTLPGALLLGAIVAPPDAVSAAAIGRRLGLPRRVMTVLSGESLINDATSLTLYRVFAAIVAGAASFNIWGTLGQFALAVVVGVVIGVVAGTGLHLLRMKISDPVVNGTFGLLAPFGIYAITEHLGGSGVLGVVAMGLVVGYNAPRTSYATRQQETPIWLSADFLLESFVFAYIGLQFPRVLADLGTGHAGGVVGLSVVVLLVVLLVRPLFVYPASAWGQLWQRMRLRRWERAVASGRMQQRMQRVEEKHAKRGRSGRVPTTDEVRQSRVVEPQLSWKDNAVVSWAGMRGAVTLATALAASDLAGLEESASHAIVVVAFVVTVGTLLLQGLTLPFLIRGLGIGDDAEAAEDAAQLAQVRARTRDAGKKYLAAKRDEWEQRHGAGALERFDRFAQRITRVERDTDQAQAEEEKVSRPSREELVDLSKGWLRVRRDVLIQERDAGALNEEVMRELIVAMDAEELALDTRLETRGDR